MLYEYRLNPKIETVDRPDSPLTSWCSDDLGLDAVRRQLEGWHPDVVYCNGLENVELERAITEQHNAILYAHSYHGTCISGRKCFSYPQIAPCRRTLGAGCLALYLPRRCGGLNPATMWSMYQDQSKRKAGLQRYRAVLVASEYMRDEFARHGVSQDRLRVVALPVSGPALPATTRDPGGNILFIGRLVDVKGVANLVKAIPAAQQQLGRKLKVTLAGSGAEQAALQSLARQFGVAADFQGWAEADKKHELMANADLLAVPSLWPEPFGLVGIEAACFGLPAVGYNVGGIRSWLTPGESGEIAPGDPPSVAGLADAIVRALSDPAHYRRLREGAWKISARFRLDRHLNELEPMLATSGNALRDFSQAVSRVVEDPEGQTTHSMGRKS